MAALERVSKGPVPTEISIESCGTVDMGFTSGAIGGCTEQHLWDAMKQTVKSCPKYYPVINFRYKDTGPQVWRQYTYNGKGSFHGTEFSEHVYTDESSKEIHFVCLDDKGDETEHEVVNALRMDNHNVLGTISGFELTPEIEIFKQNKLTKERISFELPKSEAFNAVERTADVARVIQRSYGKN